MGLGQCNSLGEYCDPRTVFLVVICMSTDVQLKKGVWGLLYVISLWYGSMRKVRILYWWRREYFNPGVKMTRQIPSPVTYDLHALCM